VVLSVLALVLLCFFFSSRRRHTRSKRDWSSDVCSSDLHLVKTVGDEVLFNAETPEAGADIALALSQALSDDPVLPSARVSVVWGRVLSRLGDIYGPTVNLAARLTALADPGTVLVDQLTANVLAEDERYILIPQPP